MLPPILTPEQVGQLLKLHPKTVKRLAEAGEIPARRVGRQWRFNRDYLIDWTSNSEATKTGTR